MIATPPDVHPDGRYNTVQTAQILGIGRTTLWRLSNAGILKPVTRSTPAKRGTEAKTSSPTGKLNFNEFG